MHAVSVLLMKLYMRNVNLGTAPVEDIVVPDIGQATARARGPDCILLTNLDCAICQFEVEMNEGFKMHISFSQMCSQKL